MTWQVLTGPKLTVPVAAEFRPTSLPARVPGSVSGSAVHLERTARLQDYYRHLDRVWFEFTDSNSYYSYISYQQLIAL